MSGGAEVVDRELEAQRPELGGLGRRDVDGDAQIEHHL
jgi:hypothetical protein